MKVEKNNILFSSKFLIIITCIFLFTLVIVFSYSSFGSGKGTYSAIEYTYTCESGDPKKIDDEYYCCPSGTKFTYLLLGEFQYYSSDRIVNHYICGKYPLGISDLSNYTVIDEFGSNSNKCYMPNNILENANSTCSSIGGVTKGGFCYYECGFAPLKATKNVKKCTFDYVKSNKISEVDIVTSESGCSCPDGWGKTSLGNELLCYKNLTVVNGCYEYDIPTTTTTISTCTTEIFPNGKKFEKINNKCRLCNSDSSSSSSSSSIYSGAGCYEACGTERYWAASRSAAISYFNTRCGSSGNSPAYTGIPQSSCGVSSNSSSSKSSSGSSKCTVTLDANGGSFSNGCSSSYTYTGTVSFNPILNKCVTKSGQCITGWKVTKGSNTGETYYSNIDQTDCGKTIQAQWGSCSSPTPSNSSVNPSSSSSKSSSSSSSKSSSSSSSKSSSSSSSKSSSSSSSNSSSSSLVDAPYDDIIDGNMCYKGEIIEVIVCQSDSISGANCKTSKGIVLKSNLISADRCNGSGGSSSGRQDAPENPKTGATMIIVLWIVGLAALFVSFFYFRKNNIV